MEIKIVSEKENPLLKRKEILFQAEHDQTGSTPPLLEIRKTVAEILKKDLDLIFIRKVSTKTGTQIANGIAHVYDSVDQAKFIEPKYIIKRNALPEALEEKEDK